MATLPGYAAAVAARCCTITLCVGCSMIIDPPIERATDSREASRWGCTPRSAWGLLKGFRPPVSMAPQSPGAAFLSCGWPSLAAALGTTPDQLNRVPERLKGTWGIVFRSIRQSCRRLGVLPEQATDELAAVTESAEQVLSPCV